MRDFALRRAGAASCYVGSAGGRARCVEHLQGRSPRTHRRPHTCDRSYRLSCQGALLCGLGICRTMLAQEPVKVHTVTNGLRSVRNSVRLSFSSHGSQPNQSATRHSMASRAERLSVGATGLGAVTDFAPALLHSSKKASRFSMAQASAWKSEGRIRHLQNQQQPHSHPHTLGRSSEDEAELEDRLEAAELRAEMAELRYGEMLRRALRAEQQERVLEVRLRLMAIDLERHELMGRLHMLKVASLRSGCQPAHGRGVGPAADATGPPRQHSSVWRWWTFVRSRREGAAADGDTPANVHGHEHAHEHEHEHEQQPTPPLLESAEEARRASPAAVLQVQPPGSAAPAPPPSPLDRTLPPSASR